MTYLTTFIKETGVGIYFLMGRINPFLISQNYHKLKSDNLLKGLTYLLWMNVPQRRLSVIHFVINYIF